MTHARTAATSALAVDALAPPSARRLAIIGSGLGLEDIALANALWRQL